MLFSLWVVAFSNSLTVLTRDQESTIIGDNLLQFPLLFLSSAFLPLEALPDWIQTFALVNPVAYGVDAARLLMLDHDVMTVIEINLVSYAAPISAAASGWLVLDESLDPLSVVLIRRFRTDLPIQTM